MIFFTKKPHVMIFNFGTILPHWKENAMDNSLIFSSHPFLNNLLHFQFFPTGKIKNFNNCCTANN